MKLSRRQREILAFIVDRIRDDGMPPTRAEINAHFGFSSPNAAQSHLRALERKGAIRLNPRLARGIVPTGDIESDPTTGSIPLIGRVAAGQPVLAIEHHERSVRIDPALFRPAPDYLLRVHGDSMIDAGIRDGDLLAVHRRQSVDDGQIVVARIDGEVTVKRIRRNRETVVLEAANPAFRNLTVSPDDDFAIEGLAVGVVRNL